MDCALYILYVDGCAAFFPKILSLFYPFYLCFIYVLYYVFFCTALKMALKLCYALHNDKDFLFSVLLVRSLTLTVNSSFVKVRIFHLCKHFVQTVKQRLIQLYDHFR